MHPELLFVVLFSVATAVAIAARRLRVPYTVALVVAGLVLGSVDLIEAPHLTKELLYAVFLPGLLFEAAFHLEFKKFWANRIAVHSLAIPGLVTAILLTAALLGPAISGLELEADFDFVYALVFAALIAATDPIAVVGLFKSLGAPKRLAVLVEGESLVNDGAAIVLFALVLEVAEGASFVPAQAGLAFLEVAGLGIVVGLVVGYAVSKVIQRVDDPMIEITLTTIAAYGSFAIAENVHVSGVLATVTAGMLCGNYAARTGMSATTRIATESFWEYLAFALNSFVFLLIGFEVRATDLLDSWLPISVAFVAVTAARAATIFGVAALLRRSRERISWSWATVLAWGGLRGGLSMVLALGLARDFPHRDIIVTMTFGVVILSILVQGMTMAPLLRGLKIIGKAPEHRAYERQQGLLRAVAAGMAELETMLERESIAPELAGELRAAYASRREAANASIAALRLERDELRHQEAIAARRHLLRAEKAAILAAYRAGTVGDDVQAELLAELDAELLLLEG